MRGRAESLHCPNCGAPADPDARRCGYCQSHLAAVTCGSCFATMFEGAAFCPACGAARPTGPAGVSGGRCPACSGELRAVDAAGTAVLECSTCDGMWLDSAQFEQICTSSESRASLLARPAEPRASITGARVRYRACLRCGKMMNRVNFARLSGTIVDVCRSHGTFLDRGELHAIVTFIHDGGLERVRQNDLASIKDAKRQLDVAKASSLHSRRTIDPGSERWDATSLSQLMAAIFGR